MSKDTRQAFERLKADIAALKNWEALPEAKKELARQNGLNWQGGGTRYYSFMTSAERTEADIAALKNWHALPEASKLFAMRHMVDWEGVHGGDYHRFMTKEVDFTTIPPDVRNEIMGGTWLPESARRPKPLHHGTYQVWYDGTAHAANVESVGVREVYDMTSKRPALWKNTPSVQVLADHPRKVRNGDVIVDPTCGAWKVEPDCFLAVDPPPAVRERMERENITPQYLQLLKNWTADMLKVTGKDDVCIAVAEPSAKVPAARWPSEIAKANRHKQSGQDQSKSDVNAKTNGHDDGHSM
jgi:hypothetical protein